jgi:hypothetical protein
MRVDVTLAKFYDWLPPPEDVDVTRADLASGRVRPAANGGYVMRVIRQGPSPMTMFLPEDESIGKIIHERCRPEGGRVLTRKQCIAFWLSEHVLPLHGKREWITKIELDDDGPDPERAKQLLAPHAISEASRVEACKSSGKHTVARAGEGAPMRCANCGHIPLVDDPAEEPNIPAAEHAAHLAAYNEKASPQDILDHLNAFFKVKGAKS